MKTKIETAQLQTSSDEVNSTTEHRVTSVPVRTTETLASALASIRQDAQSEPAKYVRGVKAEKGGE